MSTTQEGKKRKQFKIKVNYKNIFTAFIIFSFCEKKVKTITVAVCPCIFYPSLAAYELCTNREIWDMQRDC